MLTARPGSPPGQHFAGCGCRWAGFLLPCSSSSYLGEGVGIFSADPEAGGRRAFCAPGSSTAAASVVDR